MNKGTYDSTAIRTAAYRLENLEREFASFRQIVTGRDASFLTLIDDGCGCIVEKKLEELIESMINALDRCRVNVYAQAALTAQQKKLYHSFLYCAMTGPSVQTYLTNRHYPVYRVAKRFQDVVDAVRLPGFRWECPEAFWTYMLGVGEPEEPYEGFFDVMEWGLRELEQNPWSEKELSKLRQEAEKWETARLKKIEKATPGSVAQAAGTGGQQAGAAKETGKRSEDTDVVTLPNARDEEGYTAAERAELEAQRAADLDEWYSWEEKQESSESDASIRYWKSVLGDVSHLAENYRVFCELYFPEGYEQIVENVEHMIDAWLYEEGLSPLSLGDTYGLIVGHLRRSEKQLRAQVERARAFA